MQSVYRTSLPHKNDQMILVQVQVYETLLIRIMLRHKIKCRMTVVQAFLETKGGQSFSLFRLIINFHLETVFGMQYELQSALVISTSLISNNRLSRSEILVPVLTWKSKNR